MGVPVLGVPPKIGARIAVTALLAVMACGGATEQSLLVLDYPHEPAGAIQLLDYDTDFGNISDPPWGYSDGLGNLSTVTDASAPVNPNVVGRVAFAPGCCNGTGPARLETYEGAGRGTPPDTWTRWYVSDWVKFSTNFKPHDCCQKLFEFFWSSGGDKWLLVKADNNNGGNFPLIPRLHAEFSGTPPYYMPAQERELILPGVWYQYEALIHRTGRVQLWIRQQGGQSVSLYDGSSAGFGSPSNPFLFWWWGYGGLGAYPSGFGTGYIYHNHIRVSYTP